MVEWLIIRMRKSERKANKQISEGTGGYQEAGKTWRASPVLNWVKSVWFLPKSFLPESTLQPTARPGKGHGFANFMCMRENCRAVSMAEYQWCWGADTEKQGEVEGISPQGTCLNPWLIAELFVAGSCPEQHLKSRGTEETSEILFVTEETEFGGYSDQVNRLLEKKINTPKRNITESGCS